MKIIYTSQFVRGYKKLPRKIKLVAEKKEIIFRKNPFEISLDTHKLHGKLRQFWSFRINFDYRIVFEFYEKDIIYFHLAGSHSVYQ